MNTAHTNYGSDLCQTNAEGTHSLNGIAIEMTRACNTFFASRGMATGRERLDQEREARTKLNSARGKAQARERKQATQPPIHPTQASV